MQGGGFQHVTLQWILEILHDPKYLIPWELWYIVYYLGHAGFLASTVVQCQALFVLLLRYPVLLVTI